MPLDPSGSFVSTDGDNMLRGLYRDNSDHVTVGTGEDDLASTTVTANTVGATGTLFVTAAGTTTAGNETKTIKLYLGTTAIATVVRATTNAQDWLIWAKISNTSASAQRIEVIYSVTDAATLSFDYITAAENTATNLTLKITGTCSTGTAVITQAKFEAFIVQIQ